MSVLLEGPELAAAQKVFEEKMMKIYQGFPCKQTEALKPQGDFSAYFAVLQYPEKVTTAISQHTKMLAKGVPEISSYGSSVLHTTVSDLLERRVEYPRTEILEKLIKAVSKVWREVSQPEFYFPRWLYNRDSIVVEGMPTNTNFVKLFHAVRSAIEEEGLEFRAPWGCHITAARVIGAVAEGDRKLNRLHTIMREAPLIGTTKPESLVVGHGAMEDGRFLFSVEPYRFFF